MKNTVVSVECFLDYLTLQPKMAVFLDNMFVQFVSIFDRDLIVWYGEKIIEEMKNVYLGMLQENGLTQEQAEYVTKIAMGSYFK